MKLMKSVLRSYAISVFFLFTLSALAASPSSAVRVDCAAPALDAPLVIPAVPSPSPQAQSSSQSNSGGSNCSYSFGCFYLNTNDGGVCEEESTTELSFTDWGAYYCPAFGGGGGCTDAAAEPTDGVTEVHIHGSEGSNSQRFFWENGTPTTQEELARSAMVADEMFATVNSPAGTGSGAFGGWLS